MVVPLLTPYTIPVADPTVPTGVLLLLQVPVPPDAVASLRLIVNPTHTLVVPVIVPATGDTFTNTFAVVVADPQYKLVSVYSITVVPGLTPYTTPVVDPTVPTGVLLLLHVPVPPDADGLVNERVNPTHTGPAPTMAPASGDTFTVTIVVVNADPHDALVSV